MGSVVRTKTYGCDYQDGGYYVCQTSDEGYIITGFTGCIDYFWNDVWVIRTNEWGDSLSALVYGGTTLVDEGYCINPTSDSGYILTGFSETSSGNADVLIMKLKEGTMIKESKVYSDIELFVGYNFYEIIIV